MAKAKKATQKTSKKTPQKTSKKARVNPSQGIVIAVIVLAFLAVSATAFIAFFCDTKFQVEAKINDLATAYYEEYFYPNIFSGNVSMSEILEPFKDSGMTPVTLRQMVLSVPGVSESDVALLRKYCNENATSAKYFPESPYEKSSFHTEYSYSCNF